jgi:hypothetical protein
MKADVQRLMTGEAWLEFRDRLKAGAEVIPSQDVPGSALDRAEGYRNLAPAAPRWLTERKRSLNKIISGITRRLE